MYTHATEPKAVQHRKAKYREDEPPLQATTGLAANIMFDRRVVRGNTYAARILPAEPLTSEKKSTISKRRTYRQAPPRTPEPVEGRRHTDVQTDVYLEELTDVVEEADNSTQTDPFLDRPPTPVFVPPKSGVDATTQIEDGDLFDFDFEVEPILEVLVGKVLEQGLMEVLEEEELAAMRAHQQHFEQVRNAELVATQRMEAAEKRKMEEKERRLAQERERVEREHVVRAKVAASTFARGYLNGIVSSVLTRLEDAGYFYDPVEREVQEVVIPWITQSAVGYLEQGIVARQVVNQLVGAAINRLGGVGQAREERVAAQDAAVEAHDNEVAESSARASARELERVRMRATFILHNLQPPLVSEDAVEETRRELVARNQEQVEAAWEEARQKAGDEKRAELEDKVAAMRAQYEEAVATAEENGEEPPEWEEPDMDVESQVVAVMDALVKSEPPEVTDGDILSAMLEKGTLTKDAVIHALAVDAMGEAAYVHHPAFANVPDS